MNKKGNQMTMHKKIAFILLASAGIFLLHRITEKTSTPVLSGNATEEKIMQHLHSLEEKAWKKLNKCGITKEQCLEALQNLTEKPTASEELSEKPLSEKMKTLVYSVLKDFNVDPQNIQLQAYYCQSPAASTDNTILIDEKACSNYPELVLRFILGHELQHILYNDYLMSYILWVLSNQKKDTSEKLEKALAFYARFTEERADLLASLQNQKYAQGFLEFTKMTLKQDGDSAEVEKTHPGNAKRLQVAQNIVQAMSSAA